MIYINKYNNGCTDITYNEVKTKDVEFSVMENISKEIIEEMKLEEVKRLIHEILFNKSIWKDWNLKVL